MAQDIFERLSQFGVIPVIAIESPDDAVQLADTLIEAGLPVAEITFRTEAARRVIDTLACARPELFLGAGTVLTPDNVDAAKQAGAQFAVAPGFNPDVVNCAHEVGLPFAPGVATPSEIEQAMAIGCRVLKLFPAEALGGVKMLNALAGPYKHTGVKFIPTGGVNAGNLKSYLDTGIVAACGGTWVAKKEDIAEGNWEAIKTRCAEIAKVVHG